MLLHLAVQFEENNLFAKLLRRWVFHATNINMNLSLNQPPVPYGHLSENIFACDFCRRKLHFAELIKQRKNFRAVSLFVMCEMPLLVWPVHLCPLLRHML